MLNGPLKIFLIQFSLDGVELGFKFGSLFFSNFKTGELFHEPKSLVLEMRLGFSILVITFRLLLLDSFLFLHRFQSFKLGLIVLSLLFCEVLVHEFFHDNKSCVSTVVTLDGFLTSRLGLSFLSLSFFNWRLRLLNLVPVGLENVGGRDLFGVFRVLYDERAVLVLLSNEDLDGSTSRDIFEN